mgnify:FL=1
MKKLIKYYFVFSSFIVHLIGLVLVIKVAGSLDSILSFLGDVFDRL